jgi:hypothetical protein
MSAHHPGMTARDAQTGRRSFYTHIQKSAYMNLLNFPVFFLPGVLFTGILTPVIFK